MVCCGYAVPVQVTAGIEVHHGVELCGCALQRLVLATNRRSHVGFVLSIESSYEDFRLWSVYFGELLIDFKIPGKYIRITKASFASSPSSQNYVHVSASTLIDIYLQLHLSRPPLTRHRLSLYVESNVSTGVIGCAIVIFGDYR